MVVRSRDFDGTLLPVAPEAMELGRRAMADNRAWPRIEQPRLELRLPGPWVVPQPKDVALEAHDSAHPTAVLQGVVRDPTTDGLVEVEHPVLLGS